MRRLSLNRSEPAKKSGQNTPHAVLPHTVDRGLERGECRLHRAKVGRIGLNPLVAGEDRKVWNRRYLAVATPSSEGLLTERTAAAQPWGQEPLFMPIAAPQLFLRYRSVYAREIPIAALPTNKAVDTGTVSYPLDRKRGETFCIDDL